MTTRILLVEDDKDILSSVRELLESHGYIVDTASNGMRALRLLKKAQPLPDLIVLDYMMPQMDGAEFRVAQERDARIAAIPILLMTTDANPDIKQIRIGARGYIKKPLDLGKFFAAIEACLR